MSRLSDRLKLFEPSQPSIGWRLPSYEEILIAEGGDDDADDEDAGDEDFGEEEADDENVDDEDCGQG